MSHGGGASCTWGGGAARDSKECGVRGHRALGAILDGEASRGANQHRSRCGERVRTVTRGRSCAQSSRGPRSRCHVFGEGIPWQMTVLACGSLPVACRVEGRGYGTADDARRLESVERSQRG
jgi:hypothetical protein